MNRTLVFTLILFLGFSVTALADKLIFYSEAGAGTVRVSQVDPNSGYGEPQLPVVAEMQPAWTKIPDANWISSSKRRETNGRYGSWRLFTREFTLPSAAYYGDISATIEIAADNAYAIWCNDEPMGDSGISGSTNGQGGVHTVDLASWSSGPFPFQTSTRVHNFKPTVRTNILQILVRNWNAQPEGYGENSSSNPTGLVYKVVVDYNAGTIVDINVKPINKFNILEVNTPVVVPVEIYGSSTFDVRDIVQSSLEFVGLTISAQDKGQTMCLIRDANKDGYDDLVCEFIVCIEDLFTRKGKVAVCGNYHAVNSWQYFIGYDEMYLTKSVL